MGRSSLIRHISIAGAMLSFSLAPALFAQQPVSDALPAYFVGSGVTFDYYGGSGFAGTTNIALRIADSQAYNWSSIELTPKTATLRTGAAFIQAISGNWILGGLADAGVATGSGSTLASFSGGGFIGYDFGAHLTKGRQHFYALAIVRLLSTATLGPQPVYGVVIGKGF